MRTEAYERFASVCAFAAALGGILYSIAFVLILRSSPQAAETGSAIFLLLGGLLTAAVGVALFGRLRETDPSFALLALVLGLVGAVGSTIHGGFDLSVIANPPATPIGGGPNSVDPRGLLTFGVTALSLATVGWLILRGGAFPKVLGTLSLVSAGLLVIVYLGRLIVLNPKSPALLVAAVLEGFVISPVWFLLVGRSLRQAPPAA